MRSFCGLLAFAAIALHVQETFSQDVTVTVPYLGTIKGTTKMTTGNLNNPSRPFYNFKNIPFAESVSGARRFTQPVQLRTELGTPQSPYDATRSGPLCPQGGLEETSLEESLNRTMEEVIGQVLTNHNLTDQITVNQTLILLEDMFESPPLYGATFGDVLSNAVDEEISVSEDCLNLAVSTPVLPSNNPERQGPLLPVMFFIYGGGFYAGTQYRMGYERLGDVTGLVPGEDFVLVAINYRIGPLGFMCLDTDEAAGNMGLLDQIVALEWVRDNIEYFGGDPNQVTIFGESAGSASVSLLTLSPLTEGLFIRAIGESGSAIASWAYDDENAEFHARNIAEKVGCNLPDLDDLVDCMRQVPYTNITQADKEYSVEQNANGGLGFGGHDPCGQTKGARKVLEHGQKPYDILYNGDYNPVPMFFGANFDEGLLPFGIADIYAINETMKNDADWLTNDATKYIFEVCGYDVTQEEADQVRDNYFTPEQLGDYQAMLPGMIDLLGVLFLKEPAYDTIAFNSQREDSYFYSFEQRGRKSFYRIFNQMGHPELYETPFPDGYAAHADELMYIFDIPLPILFCDIGEFFTAMAAEYTRCVVQVGTGPAAEACVTDPAGPFRTEWEECLHGELLDDEKIVSEDMVKAWTNFAIYGTPTPSNSDLPHLEPWSYLMPNYIRFGTPTTIMFDYKNEAYHSSPQVASRK